MLSNHTPCNPSQNSKTGPMAQLWIYDATTAAPTEANCGTCELKTSKNAYGHSCYAARLRPMRTMLERCRNKQPNLWAAVASLRRNCMPLRLGAFGDPAAIPPEYTKALVSAARFSLGYTHDWFNRRSEHLRGVCQASVESDADMRVAHLFAWKTFRVGSGPDMFHSEVHCPGQLHKRTCLECQRCDGKRGNVYNNWH